MGEKKMTDLTKAKEQFDEALKKAVKVRFCDYESFETPLEKRITVEPEVIEICDSRNCNSGSNCVHKFKMKGIIFCIY